MIIAYAGSGGKTSLIKETAARCRAEGKKVLVTTTTHMFIEKDTLLTDDQETIIRALKETGYAMAGIPEGIKIRALSPETYAQVCQWADVVLVEADGSKHMPLKFPNETEPVIPENADEIIVVCGMDALGKKAKDACHRLELVKQCLGIGEDTIIAPEHISRLLREGYLLPLRQKYPQKKMRLAPRHDGSAAQRGAARMLTEEWETGVKE